MKETKEIKHTPGPVKLQTIKVQGEVNPRVFIVQTGDYEFKIAEVMLQEFPYITIANAELIAEAFNVSTETGLTPKHLQERMIHLENDLKDALDLKQGMGPTALATVVSERNELQERVKELMEDKESLIKSNLITVMDNNKKLSEQNKELLEALKSVKLWVDISNGGGNVPYPHDQVESAINKYTKP